MEQEFSFRDSLHIFKHRNYAENPNGRDKEQPQRLPPERFNTGSELRRVAVGNEPLLLRGMLQRILKRTPGLQVVQQPLLWPYQQREGSPGLVNWLILTHTSTPWSRSYAMPTIRACHPLSILSISPNGRNISVQPRSGNGYAATREYEDISLNMLLSILRYAPEASQAYAQARYR